jgi:hypothetical protein
MRLITSLLVGASLVFTASAAIAKQQRAQMPVDPQCRTMRDKVGCTCAVQNGGKVLPSGRWQYSGRGTPAFSACMYRAGR